MVNSMLENAWEWFKKHKITLLLDAFLILLLFNMQRIEQIDLTNRDIYWQSYMNSSCFCHNRYLDNKNMPEFNLNDSGLELNLGIGG